MIISRVSLRREAGTQGALARVLLDGAAGDRGHGLIWTLFASANGAEREFLYRQIDAGSFIIVSRRPPEDVHGLWNVSWQEYTPALQPGQRLRFILRANPAVSVRQAGGKRGPRADAVMHAKSKLALAERKGFDPGPPALDWLYTRRDLGAAFEREHCSATGYQQIIIRKKDMRQPVTFSEVEYEGVLTATDPEKLTAALYKGVGKAKAYGCGLLLVRPA